MSSAAAAAATRTSGVTGVLPNVTVVSTDSPVVLVKYEDLADKKDISASIAAAFGQDGLGIIVVSGVPEFTSLRSKLLPLSRKFALLPDAIKAKYEHAASHWNFGWSHGRETLAGKPDLAKGSYYANPLYDEPFTDAALVEKFPSFCAPNLWPTEDLPELEPAFKNLGKLVCETGFLLAQHCDTYVQSVLPSYPSNRLHDIIAKSRTAKARLLHYFPMTASEAQLASQDGSWCGWHNDHGSLTGLCSAMFFNEQGEEIANPDPKSGLYIRSRTGATVKAVIPADCLAFQMGETQQIHSCGVLQATPHCVMAGTVPNVSRETFAIFMEPEMFEPMTVPAEADQTRITGGTTAYLPKGVPHLSVRWKNEYDFGTFTNETLKAYHPEEKKQEATA
jgi:isopenicillin N synthase-like dioxygenase